jgi:hypothetical protein
LVCSKRSRIAVFDIIVSSALRQLSDYEDRCPAIFIPNDATEEAQELAQVAHHTIMGSVSDQRQAAMSGD